MSQQKLLLKDIPVANKKIITYTSKVCKLPEGKVEEFLNFIGTYTADVIRSGTMETVMLPYLGKFRAKKKVVSYFAAIKLNAFNGKDLVYRAINGMKLIDKRPKNKQ